MTNEMTPEQRQTGRALAQLQKRIHQLRLADGVEPAIRLCKRTR